MTQWRRNLKQIFAWNLVIHSVLLSAALGDANLDPFNRGMELVSSRKYAEAVVELEKAVKEDGTFLNARLELARACVMAGRRKEGLKAMDAALPLAKRDAERKRIEEQRRLLTEIFYTNASFQHYQDGLNYLTSMKLRASIESFEQALAREQDNIVVLLGYARALQAVDDWKESTNVLDQAFALDPNRLETRTLLARATLNSNPSRTLQVLRPLLDDPKVNEEIVVIYAQALAKQGNRKDALILLDTDLTKNQDRPQVLFWLGKFSAEAPENRWLARRHLQAFLLRADRQKEREDLQTLRVEAKRLLQRVDGDLGISGPEN